MSSQTFTTETQNGRILPLAVVPVAFNSVAGHVGLNVVTLVVVLVLIIIGGAG